MQRALDRLPIRLAFFPALTAALLALAFSLPASAEPYVAYSHFQALPDSVFGKVQARIAYVGDPKTPLPSVCFAARGATPEPRLFAGLCRPPTLARTPLACVLSVAELRSLVDSVAAMAELAGAGMDSLAMISFALLDTSGGTMQVSESSFDRRSGLQFVNRAFAALRSSAGAAQILAVAGCGLGASPEERAQEVTSEVMVALDGLSYDASSREVSCTLRVTNRAGTALPLPLVAVLESKAHAVRLVDPDGYSCRVFAPGAPFVVLAGSSSLAPGAEVARRLRFENPRQESFEIVRRVFTGWPELESRAGLAQSSK